MELTRIYRNSNEDELRVDTIIMERRSNTISKNFQNHTFQRNLKTQFYFGPADRVVADIQVIGDFTSIEQSSGNFMYAEWASPPGTCDMSDLPIIGDTV
jgi:hypothetical protein